MKVIYHNDLDGRCAGAIVAQHTGNYNIEDYFEVDYIMDLPLDKIPNGETVYFVDYSFKKDTKHVLDELVDKSCNVIWIDHHSSSMNLIKEYPYLNELKGIRQEGISGAALTYMYLYGCDFEEIPYYIKLVSDYDCWQYKFDPNTTYFKIGVEAQNYNALDDIWIDLMIEWYEWYFSIAPDKQNVLSSIFNDGKTIKTYIDADNTYYRNNFAYESIINGHKVLVVNKKSNSWIFGERYNEYPLVCVWVFNGTKYSYSIFSSNPEIDCSKIAESYGGGGHKSAAGFSSDELLFKKIEIEMSAT